MGTKRIYLFRLLLFAAVLSLNACQLKKNLSTHKSSSAYAEEKNMAVLTEQTELSENNRVIHIVDSADHSYHVTIFPADTFTYSPQKGFQGRARQVEIRGRQKTRSFIADSAARYSVSQSNSRADMKASLAHSREAKSKIKEKEQENVKVWVVLGLVGVVLAGVVIGRKYRRLLRG